MTSETSPELLDLFERAKSDEDVQREMLIWCVPYLQKVARAWLRRHDPPPRFGIDADDLLSWGWMGVARRLNFYDPDKGPLIPWICAVAKYSMTQEVRKLYRRHKAGLLHSDPPSHSHPWARLEYAEMMERYTARLSDTQRRVFTLVVEGGQTFGEAAAEGGWTRSYAYASYCSSVRQVAHSMIADGYGDGKPFERPRQRVQRGPTLRGLHTRKPVVNEKGDPFPSARAAAEALGVSSPALTKAIRTGQRCGGLKWWYTTPPAA